MPLKLDNIDKPIVERELWVSDSERLIKIIVGRPELFSSDSQDFYCPYQIFGLGDEKIRYGAGVDSMQALILTLERIGADLYSSKEGKAGQLRWINEQGVNLGFRTPSGFATE